MPEHPESPGGLEAPLDENHEPEQDESARLRAKRARARKVLWRGLLVILAGLGIYAIWPWLLPAFIYEGPLVQMAGETEVTLVWYLSRPTSGNLSVTIGDEPATIPVETDGRRCRTVLTDRQPGTTCSYTIRLGDRVLAEHELRTNKRAGEPFSFLVFGDSGKATPEQYWLADRMAALDVDFVLHTGDLVYSNGERHRYKNRFFEPYRALLRRVCFWPSIGNHDVFEPIDESPYFDVFELPENGPPGLSPEHDYWFDYASARIAIVDSERDEAALRDHVAPWLRSVLSETDARWKFVVFHRPPFTGGAHAPRLEIQRTLVPVFEETGVDVVFNGHDHMYERTHPIRAGEVAADGAGVVYIISGAGGAMLYEAMPPEQRPAYIAAINTDVHSFTSVSVSDNELTLEQIAVDGEILDQWTLRKAEPTADAP